MESHSILSIPLSLLVLIALHALCASAELSLAGVRRARVEQLVRERRSGARALLRALDAPERIGAAAQLGQALAASALGLVTGVALLRLLAHGATWLAGVSPVAAGVLSGPVSWVLAGTVAVALVASLHVVLGQQLPAVLSEQRTEAVALVAVPVVGALALVVAPLALALSRVTARLVRLLGLVPADVHALAATPEEIQVLVERSEEGGEIEPDESRLIQGVFEFGDLVAREVMTPRRDLVALPVDAARAEVLEVVVREAHSRIPVYEGSLDAIVGVLLVKDLIPHLLEPADAATLRLRDVMREPYFIPDGKPVSEVLAELRAHGLHMAVVLDEFGGTEGVVTLEDLIEPIVGEIYDEYDVPEPDDFSLTADGDVLVDGGAAVDEVNQRVGLHLPEGDFDTIGGLVFGELGRLPRLDDQVAIDGALFRVEQVDERRIVRLRMTPRLSAPPPPVEPKPVSMPEPAAAD